MLLETLKRHWWIPVLRGVAAIIFGVIAFTHPVMAAVTLVWFFGEWFLILMGLASIIFAGLLLWNPLAGAAALIWIIAWYAVIMGVLAIIFGIRLRSLATLATR